MTKQLVFIDESGDSRQNLLSVFLLLLLYLKILSKPRKLKKPSIMLPSYLATFPNSNTQKHAIALRIYFLMRFQNAHFEQKYYMLTK